MPRYEYNDEKSNKFWEVTLVENELHLAWGAIGTAGRNQTKSFADVDSAKREMHKLISEKTSKGYASAGEAAPISKSKYYFDDEEEGLARETSHPNFVKLAKEDFYYDCGDDFSPFGSDDGSDTFGSLEEWYQDGGKDAKVMQFLKALLADWDFGLPRNILTAEADVIEKWLNKDDMHETYLQSECRARIATAFGQFKITGSVIAECRDEGLVALERMLWFNERSKTKYPGWAHQEEEFSKLTTMRAVLMQL